MHRGVITCSPELPGSKVAQVMAAHRIHAVVVTAPGTEPRAVTDGDVASALYAGTLGTSTAAELSSAMPIVGPDDTLAHAIGLMHDRKSTHAIVVTGPSRPVGVVSMLDLAEAIGDRR
jgi:CBS domain-containing protein